MLLDVGAVTTWFLDRLNAVSEYEVGDGIAPLAAGWPEGTPNSLSTFVPYLVLSEVGSSVLEQNRALCRTYATRFDMRYRLTAYHVSRASVDQLSAVGREALMQFSEELPPDLGDLSLRRSVWLESLVGATRDDSTYPQTWSASTLFRLSVAKA